MLHSPHPQDESRASSEPLQSITHAATCLWLLCQMTELPVQRIQSNEWPATDEPRTPDPPFCGTHAACRDSRTHDTVL